MSLHTQVIVTAHTHTHCAHLFVMMHTADHMPLGSSSSYMLESQRGMGEGGALLMATSDHHPTIWMSRVQAAVSLRAHWHV